MLISLLHLVRNKYSGIQYNFNKFIVYRSSLSWLDTAAISSRLVDVLTAGDVLFIMGSQSCAMLLLRAS